MAATKAMTARAEADHAGHVARDRQRDQDHGRMQVDRAAVDDGRRSWFCSRVATLSSTNRMIVAWEPTVASAVSSTASVATSGPMYGMKPPAKTRTASGAASGRRREEQHQADDRPDAGQDPGAAQVATDALDRVPAGGLDLRPMPLVGRLHDATPQAVAVGQDVVRREERQDGDGDCAGDVPGYAGELAGDPPARRGDAVLDGRGRIRRRLGFLEARLELRRAARKNVAIWPA